MDQVTPPETQNLTLKARLEQLASRVPTQEELNYGFARPGDKIIEVKVDPSTGKPDWQEVDYTEPSEPVLPQGYRKIDAIEVPLTGVLFATETVPGRYAYHEVVNGWMTIVRTNISESPIVLIVSGYDGKSVEAPLGGENDFEANSARSLADALSFINHQQVYAGETKNVQLSNAMGEARRQAWRDHNNPPILGQAKNCLANGGQPQDVLSKVSPPVPQTIK